MITKVLAHQTGKLKITIPTNLNELTLGTLIALQESQDMDDLDAISILSGISKDELKNLKNFTDVDVFSEHIFSLSHQLKYTYNEKALPETIYFGKVKVKVIKNLSIEPAGAFMAARDIMADEINKHIAEYGEDNWKANIKPSPKSCGMILAHYFYCRVTGNKYEEQKAEEFFDQVKDLPVQVALPIARYFFLNYPNLLKQKISLWQVIKQNLKRKQALRRLKSSDI